MLIGALPVAPPLIRAEWWTVDKRMMVRGPRATKNEVVIVGIDNKCDKNISVEQMERFLDHIGSYKFNKKINEVDRRCKRKSLILIVTKYKESV